jgi:hypothetical protein
VLVDRRRLHLASECCGRQPQSTLGVGWRAIISDHGGAAGSKVMNRSRLLRVRIGCHHRIVTEAAKYRLSVVILCSSHGQKLPAAVSDDYRVAGLSSPEECST